MLYDKRKERNFDKLLAQSDPGHIIHFSLPFLTVDVPTPNAS